MMTVDRTHTRVSYMIRKQACETEMMAKARTTHNIILAAEYTI